MGKTRQLDWASGLSTLNIERKNNKKAKINKTSEIEKKRRKEKRQAKIKETKSQE